MAQINITLKDTSTGAEAKANFDPTIVRGQPKTMAQELAIRILNFISSDAHQVRGSGEDGRWKTLYGERTN